MTADAAGQREAFSEPELTGCSRFSRGQSWRPVARMLEVRWSKFYHQASTYGSVSTIMLGRGNDRIELLRGTLDMLILKTLVLGPAHGHQIARYIQTTTDDLLQVEHGSLYPALHRLERKGWIASKWEMAKERNRELRFYRLTASGKKQLLREESKWERMAGAIAQVMWAVEGSDRG
jgi:PadR family transcriptional regulator PadR